MTQNDFFRFAILVSNGQATTFRKNLTKMIILVLYDSYGRSITIFEIINKIRENYGLSFSDNEIQDIFRKSQDNTFIETRPTTDIVYYLYTINPDTYEKIRKKDNVNSLNNIIDKFLKIEGMDCPFKLNDFNLILHKFLYNTFNADVGTVLALMDYKGEILLDKINPDILSNDEITWLNSFLNWDDIEKNKVLFSIISSCFEFCMMTVKKDSSSFKSLFKGKIFYLDANVIFRLAGFNNIERRDIVLAFLNKCKECGIDIKYTNFTSQEIDETLNYHVNQIRKLFVGKTPICIDAFKSLTSKFANLDFYAQYVEWIKIPGNSVGDYSSFTKYLKKLVNEYIEKMEFSKSVSFKKNKDYRFYFDDLCDYKTKRKRNTNEASLNADVENFFFMQQFDELIKSNNFFDKKHYFISTDQIYINWACEKTPGSIPTFILPSVWYSLMLKYCGRSSVNDYNAFCHFLNLRFSIAEDELSIKKEEILSIVIDLDESASIKEEIIFDINERLSKGNISIEDAEIFVEESHNRITEKKINEAIINIEKQHNQEKDNINKINSDIIQETKTLVYKEGLETGIKEGTIASIEKIAKKQSTDRLKINKIINIIFFITIIISVLIFLIAFILSFIKKEDITIKLIKILNENSSLITIISLCFAAITTLTKKILSCINIFSLDYDVVYEKIRNKLEKEYDD